MKRILVAAALTILSGCQVSQVIPAQKAQPLTVPAAKQEIAAMTAHSRCDNVEQCRVAGDVVKACGGFSSFIAYSSVDVNEAVLKEKLQAYYALQKAQNAERRQISDCALISPPAPRCVNSRCILSNLD